MENNFTMDVTMNDVRITGNVDNMTNASFHPLTKPTLSMDTSV